MNKADLIKNGFYVALTGTDEEKRAIAIEVIDKAVEAGAELMEGVSYHHDGCRVMTPSVWGYVGVQANKTYIEGHAEQCGPTATKLTLQQFREVFGGNATTTSDITKNKYQREIKHGVFVDVYDVLQAWGVINPALQHLIKKALQPGERGHKTKAQDMQDIIDSAVRAKALEPDA